MTSIPASAATSTMAIQSTAGGKGDIAGEASNAYKVAEAKALWGYIKKRPIYGYGFGKVASDFSTGYSYELSYLDLLLKAGLIGLLLYLSFPLRLIVDACGCAPVPRPARERTTDRRCWSRRRRRRRDPGRRRDEPVPVRSLRPRLDARNGRVAGGVHQRPAAIDSEYLVPPA